MGKVKRKRSVIVHGMDLSLNHAGIVEHCDGEAGQFWYVTDLVASYKKGAKTATRLPAREKGEDRDCYEVRRLAWWLVYLDEHARKYRPDYVGIEGYALGKSQGAHQMGELGGLARLVCYQNGIRLRVHDPATVKMFTAYDGNAKKPEMEEAVLYRWGADFSDYNPPRGRPTKKNPQGAINRQTSEDLADAFAISKIVWTEVQLRSGKLTMDRLHPKEIQAFNRVTKAYPVNILGRGWIERS